jgi:hypothetical protein
MNISVQKTLTRYLTAKMKTVDEIATKQHHLPSHTIITENQNPPL